MLCRLTRAIEQRVPEVAYANDPLKGGRPELHSSTRRRRVDEDYKRAVTTRVCQEGRAQSGAAYLRATGDHAGHVQGHWVALELLRYQAASWVNADQVRVCSLAADAARLGNPAEDTLGLAAWIETDHRDFGVVLPPQVLLSMSIRVVVVFYPVCSCSVVWAQPSVCLDVSEGGCLLRTHTRLRVETYVCTSRHAWPVSASMFLPCCSRIGIRIDSPPRVETLWFPYRQSPFLYRQALLCTAACVLSHLQGFQFLAASGHGLRPVFVNECIGKL